MIQKKQNNGKQSNTNTNTNTFMHACMNAW